MPRSTRGNRATARPAAVACLAGVLVFILALPGVWARSTYGAQVSVDEPQYLMTALSLAHELDLDVSDEVRDGSFRSFHEPDLNPQTRPVDPEGRRFSPHDPLLPALLAPAMRLAPDGVVSGPADDTGPRGWVAARLTIAAIAALTAAVTAWVAMTRVGARPTTAALVITLGFSAVPLGPYATQIYPEMPAALATIAAIAALTTANSVGRRHLLVTMLSVIALPWLAVKYVPVAAVLALWLFARLQHDQRDRRTRHARGRVDRRVMAGIVLAVAGVVYAVVHQRIYGGWTVYASGDHFSETGELSVVGTSPDYLGRSRRLLGLLVDRSFGLIPWQPLWLLAPAAIAAHARRSTGWRWPLLVLAAGWFTATFIALTMHGWWSPGRQVVVVAPIALVSVAWLVDRSRALTVVAGVLGLLGSINWLWLAIEASTGRRTIVVDFVDTAAIPYRVLDGAFPDALTNTGTGLFVAWGVLAAASIVAGWRMPSAASRSGSSSGGPEVGRRHRHLPFDLSLETSPQANRGLPTEQAASKGRVG